jgi:hypothetical protein
MSATACATGEKAPASNTAVSTLLSTSASTSVTAPSTTQSPTTTQSAVGLLLTRDGQRPRRQTAHSPSRVAAAEHLRCTTARVAT